MKHQAFALYYFFALRPGGPRRRNASASRAASFDYSTDAALMLGRLCGYWIIFFFFAFRISAGYPLGEDSVKSQTEKRGPDKKSQICIRRRIPG
jgi:hypothetical protein